MCVCVCVCVCVCLCECMVNVGVQMMWGACVHVCVAGVQVCAHTSIAQAHQSHIECTAAPRAKKATCTAGSLMLPCRCLPLHILKRCVRVHLDAALVRPAAVIMLHSVRHKSVWIV